MYLAQSLVGLIERNADSLAKRWLNIVTTHPSTPTFHHWNERELYNRVFKVYSNLGRWISEQTTKSDIEREYVALGRERHAEGFALSEVLEALVISRRVLWLKVQDSGFLNTALDLNLALELNNKVVLFFDRAIRYTAVGYEEAMKTAATAHTIVVKAAHR